MHPLYGELNCRTHLSPQFKIQLAFFSKAKELQFLSAILLVHIHIYAGKQTHMSFWYQKALSSRWKPQKSGLLRSWGCTVLRRQGTGVAKGTWNTSLPQSCRNYVPGVSRDASVIQNCWSSESISIVIWVDGCTGKPAWIKARSYLDNPINVQEEQCHSRCLKSRALPFQWKKRPIFQLSSQSSTETASHAVLPVQRSVQWDCWSYLQTRGIKKQSNWSKIHSVILHLCHASETQL